MRGDGVGVVWQASESGAHAPEPAVVDLWMIAPDALQIADSAALRRLLSDAEVARADAFAAAEPRAEFVACRALLRLLLGAYTGREAAGLRIVEGPSGKPRVELEAGEPRIEFSVSHSKGWGLLAFSRSGAVGVDLEANARAERVLPLTERFFSPREVAVLRALEPQAAAAQFTRFWTRREAWFKALELDALPTRDFCAAFADGERETVREHRSSGGSVERWRIIDLEPGGGFQAAVVVPDDVRRVRCVRCDAGSVKNLRDALT